MNGGIDDTTLARFMDGELDLAGHRAVEQALAADPALRERLERLRAVDGTVRAAFDHVTRLPLPPLRAPVVPLRAAPARPRWFVPLSAAAALVAMVATGIVAFELGQQRQVELAAAREAETVALEKTFQRVIDTELSGTTVEWRSPGGDARAELTPVRTWKTETGRYCREFTEVIIRGGVEREEGGVACRRDDGTWRVRVRYFPD